MDKDELCRRVAVDVMQWEPDYEIGGYDGTPHLPKGKKHFEAGLHLTPADAMRVVERMRGLGFSFHVHAQADGGYYVEFRGPEGIGIYVAFSGAFEEAVFRAALDAVNGKEASND